MMIALSNLLQESILNQIIIVKFSGSDVMITYSWIAVNHCILSKFKVTKMDLNR